MKPLTGFEAAGGRGFFHPTGSASAGQLADMVTAALGLARGEGLRDVLINISEMTGFDSPGIAYRRWVARRWAATVEGTLRVAVVARREYICPKKTGLLVAAEEGLDAHICETDAEAIAWLNAAAEEPS